MKTKSIPKIGTFTALNIFQNPTVAAVFIALQIFCFKKVYNIFVPMQHLRNLSRFVFLNVWESFCGIYAMYGIS